MNKIKSKSFSEMPQQEFQASYVVAVNENDSYVGGVGGLEDDLWFRVEAHQKWAKRHSVILPEYEAVERTQKDWV